MQSLGGALHPDAPGLRVPVPPTRNCVSPTPLTSARLRPHALGDESTCGVDELTRPAPQGEGGPQSHMPSPPDHE
eukprot:9208107-Heterocapsa_arctica.AAC.1